MEVMDPGLVLEVFLMDSPEHLPLVSCGILQIVRPHRGVNYLPY